MSWSDPIADMLTRIRNAQKARLPEVTVPASRVKGEIARVFQAEGYIAGFRRGGAHDRDLNIALKYGGDGEPAICGLRRGSRPGLRRYCGASDMPRVLGGLGVAVISTSGGIMSGREAGRRKLGGEWLCSIW